MSKEKPVQLIELMYATKTKATELQSENDTPTILLWGNQTGQSGRTIWPKWGNTSRLELDIDTFEDLGIPSAYDVYQDNNRYYFKLLLMHDTPGATFDTAFKQLPGEAWIESLAKGEQTNLCMYGYSGGSFLSADFFGYVFKDGKKAPSFDPEGHYHLALSLSTNEYKIMNTLLSEFKSCSMGNQPKFKIGIVPSDYYL